MASDQNNHGGFGQGSVREYIVGLTLSILLTAVAFGVVMTGIMSGTSAVILILLCAVGQVLVQLVFFLHMNTSSEQLWNTSSAIFTVVLIAILIIGSIWIMAHLNHNMLMGH